MLQARKHLMHYARIFNIGMRGLTLGSRFLFVFFIAKLLEPADLGLYGLVTAATGYALYLVGLDFYTYATRELLQHDRGTWGLLLKNQLALSLVLYALVLPGLTLVFVNDWLPWSVAKWFYLLVVLEHICQELGRIFIAVSEQLMSSLVLFLRQGVWAIVITGLMLANHESRTLNAVFAAWSLSCILAIFIGIRRLRQLKLGGWSLPVDWSWISTGIKISVPMLLGTLAIRGIFTVDRYWLQALNSLDVVGAYVLFISIASTVMVFLDAGIFSFSYPALIQAHQQNEHHLFRSKIREMILQTAIVLILFSVLSLLMLPWLLQLIAKPLYNSYQYLYFWLLAATILNAISMIPHYALYSQRLDKPIIHSHFLGFLVFCASTWLLSQHRQDVAIPAGLCCAFAFMCIWKTIAFFKLTPNQYWQTSHPI